MAQQASAHSPNETGGVLLGQSFSEGARVTHIVDAGPAAQHTPMSFIPDRDWQYDRIDDVFFAAHGNVEYLGDWHSHPGAAPRPSPTDRELLRATAANAACRCPRPLMLILGYGGNAQRWAPAAYRFEPTAGDWSRRIRRAVLVTS